MQQIFLPRPCSPSATLSFFVHRRQEMCDTVSAASSCDIHANDATNVRAGSASASSGPSLHTHKPTPAQTFLQRLRLKTVEGARAYFTDDGSRQEGARTDDPLVEVVHRDPAAALLFIKAVMVFGAAGGVLVSISSMLFLAIYWSHCASCDRPLRWWLVVHSLLQLTQVPVRVVFLASLKSVEAELGDSLIECVSRITASPAWRTSKQVSLMTYGWFVLGVVWVMNAGNCSVCPGLYWMTVAVIAQAIARALLALVCFRVLFPSVDARQEEVVVKGATEDMIADLPVIRFRPHLFEPGAGCAVCLADYDMGNHVRKLPCGHHFHQRCCDQWLRQNKKCPLCMGAIDAPRGEDVQKQQ